MKYIIPDRRVGEVEKLGYNMIQSVSIEPKSISLDLWGRGWIIDADDSFDLFCVLTYGWKPIELTDIEYSELLLAKVLFMEKIRGKKLNNSFQNLFCKDK
jgi:hypothetical protein